MFQSYQASLESRRNRIAETLRYEMSSATTLVSVSEQTSVITAQTSLLR